MITRRTVLKGTAAAGLLAGASRLAMPALAQGKPIKLGYVSPQTGPLAGFAEADKFIIDSFLAATKAKGLKYEVIVKDSQSNPNRAAEVAKELIVTNKINLMLVASTPETTNPVSTTCEAEEMPCISTVAPMNQRYRSNAIVTDGEPEPSFEKDRELHYQPTISPARAGSRCSPALAVKAGSKRQNVSATSSA
jgi:branched-chain amino acid transport system substrate-binding protein